MVLFLLLQVWFEHCIQARPKWKCAVYLSLLLPMTHMSLNNFEWSSGDTQFLLEKQDKIYLENLTKLFKGDSQIGNRWLLNRDQFLSIICEELYGTEVP